FTVYFHVLSNIVFSQKVVRLNYRHVEPRCFVMLHPDDEV
ncbi:hypothetical protein CP8484711_0692B, partial [Chlamydia psittaci 84-8471/1]